MTQVTNTDWKNLIVSPEQVLTRIMPGMSIFLGSGVAEPRTLLDALMSSDHSNTKDLELVQLNSHGDLLSLKKLNYQNYRLKTFFSGWVASEVAASGSIDLIPARYSQIPFIFKSKQIPIDAAFIQVTPPNSTGYCSLGVAVDVAREAMDQASFVVGEINPKLPFTFGDTLVSVSDFDMMIQSTTPPIYFNRWPVTGIMEQVAKNIASVIDDGDCISFPSINSLVEALCRQLGDKRHLGIHSPYFTDASMDLVKSGIVSNYRKGVYRGKSMTSYALGSTKLMDWLHLNPLIEFQSIDKVCNPALIGANPNFVSIFHARKVDLFGRVAFHTGKGSLTSGPGIAEDMISGTELSSGGRTIFGLPSRSANGKSNILGGMTDQRNQFHMRESINMIVTEYGTANLKWRSIRERAQALIEIAHPDDRAKLFEQAKKKNILFQDQIFISESARLYPMGVTSQYIFKNGLKVRFRAVKPSDEETMRRLFYRISGRTIYRRFFYPIKTMPHNKMQKYVNIDYQNEMSIVGLIKENDQDIIIAEARYARDERTALGEVAFIVDERFQGLGIGRYIYNMLIRLAKERGLTGFTAEVLYENTEMMKVFEKGDLPVEARLQNGIYSLTILFDNPET